MKIYFAGGEAEFTVRPECVSKDPSLLFSFARLQEVSPTTLTHRWMLKVIEVRQEIKQGRRKRGDQSK